MFKSEIRKKILKIRKKKYPKNEEINFNKILLNILKKEKINNKIIGGYYPYNYEIDAIKILKNLKKKLLSFFTKIKKTFKWIFLVGQLKIHYQLNKYGIPEPTSNKIKLP